MEDPVEQLMNAICEDGDDAASIIAIDAAITHGALAGTAAEPLRYAAQCRRPQIIRHLYARGATLASELPANLAGMGGGALRGKSQGDTALHAVAEDRWLEGLELILSLDPAPKAALAVYDMCQKTPLIIAAAQGDLACVQLLLEHGADVNEYDADNAGDSALAEAAEGGHIEVVRLLLSHGADVNARGWMGITPLERARKLAVQSPEVLTAIEETKSDLG